MRRVKHFRLTGLDRQGIQRRRFTTCQRIGGGGQALDVRQRTLLASGEMFDQLRHQGAHFVDCPEQL